MRRIIDWNLHIYIYIEREREREREREIWESLRGELELKRKIGRRRQSVEKGERVRETTVATIATFVKYSY
jgi:hypothetical protein